ncbi:Hypothetical protein CINCED_3A005809 [Cinara cedri]|uniref:peptidylamidoglycolate lyase n=1 Tax=Cinara cedri TaxID=506608 RepID=A0A5E4M089_9HEMI|nr:Hypothetical protein CINCED_3A005809 [Cinara cedri]
MATTAATALFALCFHLVAAVSDQKTSLDQGNSLSSIYGQNQVYSTSTVDSTNAVDNTDTSTDVFNQFHLHESPEWPFPRKIDSSIGQISGVSISKDNLVYIFHRGDREWNDTTFLYNNVYRNQARGPITEPAVLVLDSKNGSVINRWGSNRFYMPHGITVDHDNNVWLTDVALHQVFKFSPSSENSTYNLILTLGTSFEPGQDFDKFCKPTSVAVATSGEFYVADGYCNSRIVKFSADGRVLLEWGRSTKVSGDMTVPPYQLWIPHALTLAEDKKIICVADRENGRVVCFNMNNGTFVFEINPQLFQRIFSVAYTPVAGGLFYVLNDRNADVNTIPESLAQGFVINATTLEVIGRFHPGDNEFVRPHDMAVSPDGSSVYVVELIRSHVRKFVLDCSRLRENSGKKILVFMLVIAVGLFFTAAIFVTVLIYTRTKSMVHREDMNFGRWQPRTLVTADGFNLGNIFNKKQRAGFEKLATVEVSEDDDDGDDDINDLNVRA